MLLFVSYVDAKHQHSPVNLTNNSTCLVPQIYDSASCHSAFGIHLL